MGNVWEFYRKNVTQVTICTKPSEFFQIITDDQHVIHRIEKSRKKNPSFQQHERSSLERNIKPWRRSNKVVVVITPWKANILVDECKERKFFILHYTFFRNHYIWLCPKDYGKCLLENLEEIRCNILCSKVQVQVYWFSSS